MRTIVVAMAGMFLLSGCGGLRTSIAFTGKAGDGKFITGSVKGSLKQVQEFRSLLEALEYRGQEKPK